MAQATRPIRGSARYSALGALGAALALSSRAAADYVSEGFYPDDDCRGSAVSQTALFPTCQAVNSGQPGTAPTASMSVTCVNATYALLNTYSGTTCSGVPTSSFPFDVYSGTGTLGQCTSDAQGEGATLSTCVSGPYTPVTTGFVETIYGADVTTCPPPSSGSISIQVSAPVGVCVGSSLNSGGHRSAMVTCDGATATIAEYNASTTCQGVPTTIELVPLGCNAQEYGTTLIQCTGGGGGSGGGGSKASTGVIVGATIGGVAAAATVAGAVVYWVKVVKGGAKAAAEGALLLP